MQRQNNVRREMRTITDRMRGGKLCPAMAVPFREGESGSMTQSVMFELDPVAGRVITPITAEVVSVFVPVQAIDALKNPEQDYAGNTEVIRDKLLSGTPLFDLEEESEISKRLGVQPRSIAGVKKVNEVARLAQIAAVNFLRRRKYVYAAQLDKNSTAITPALIAQTVLDRLNGVLDPEDRINGAVQFDLPNVQLPVSGLLVKEGTNYNYPTGTYRDTAGNVQTGSGDGKNTGVSGAVHVKTASAATDAIPQVYAEMQDIEGTAISLQDFYDAEMQDKITRYMRQMLDDNPEYGEEMVLRWAHGLTVDAGKQPFIIHNSTQVFGAQRRYSTDATALDVSQSDFMAQISFNVTVPRTELGGVVVTFVSVKPDETLLSQPHPILSEEWGAINFVADEFARDPVPVTIRELYADCELADEGTRALYTGHNELKRAYVNYGFSRRLDPNDVDDKTAIWQLAIPMSVTPESVIYPEDLDHYIFLDQQAEICTYTCSTMVNVNTPYVFGPTPVEEMAIIETANIFEEE